MQAANLMIEVNGREADLAAAKARSDDLEKYLEDVLRQNEQFVGQIAGLNAKVGTTD